MMESQTPQDLTPKNDGTSSGDPLSMGSSKSSNPVFLNQMQAQILNLCRALDQSVATGEFDCKKWISELNNYVSNSQNRLLYNDISNYIFSKNGREYGSMMTNLETVIDYAMGHLRPDEGHPDKEKEILYKTILKFYDHLNLAQKQVEMFDSDRKSLQQDIELEVKTEISNATKDITSQLVGLVALFTAMSFLVFGGIASLDSIFKSVERFVNLESSVLPVLLVAIAWAFCMMNLLFGFMYFVLRLVKPEQFTIRSEKNMVQRYPVVFLANYILLCLFVLFAAVWFVSCYDVALPILNFVINNPLLICIVGAAVFIGFFFLLGWHLWAIYTNTDTPFKSVHHFLVKHISSLKNALKILFIII